MAPSIIANPGYAEMGKLKISWARKHMPIMSQVVKTHWPAQPLDGYTIVTSVHLEAKTACLVQALTSLGAEVYATGCNPLSTQDDVAAALAETCGVTVYARHNHPEE
ncbi:MAG: adenosylhomocysteinase, partial [Exiguobacterium sp.]|nr:adenosylhomocysteinase [Exiguobacterium sp.]